MTHPAEPEAQLASSHSGPVTLDDIRAPIEDELDVFQEYFREAMRSDVGLLDKVTQYVLKQKGKRIRPTLVLLSAKLFGSVSDTSYRAAALVEILHSATLIHDDVVDGAEKRRGMFSVNALWKNKVSVLFGDFLLSRGLLLSLENHDYAVLHTLSDAIRRMSEGELLQIEKSRLLNLDEETYLRIISDKTASLIAACVKAGALSASDDQEAIDKLHHAGEKLGLAFQIRDDLFDYVASESGKPIGIDLQEKKLTLPLIHAMQESSWLQRQRIMRLVRKSDKSERDLKRIRDFVDQEGGMVYARSKMHDYANEAAAIFEDFPPTPARKALFQLVQFTVQRNR